MEYIAENKENMLLNDEKITIFDVYRLHNKTRTFVGTFSVAGYDRTYPQCVDVMRQKKLRKFHVKQYLEIGFLCIFFFSIVFLINYALAILGVPQSEWLICEILELCEV